MALRLSEEEEKHVNAVQDELKQSALKIALFEEENMALRQEVEKLKQQKVNNQDS